MAAAQPGFSPVAGDGPGSGETPGQRKRAATSGMQLSREIAAGPMMREAVNGPRTKRDLAVPSNSYMYFKPEFQSVDTRFRIQEREQGAPTFASPEDLYHGVNRLLLQHPSLSNDEKVEQALQNYERVDHMRAYIETGDLNADDVRRIMRLHTLGLMAAGTDDQETKLFQKEVAKKVRVLDRTATRDQTEQPATGPHARRGGQPRGLISTGWSRRHSTSALASWGRSPRPRSRGSWPFMPSIMAGSSPISATSDGRTVTTTMQLRGGSDAICRAAAN